MRARLLVSFAIVTLTGAAALAIAIRVMVPTLYDEKTRAGRGGPTGAAGGDAQTAAVQHDAVVSAVNTAMVIALAASLLCSALIAVMLSKRNLRNLDRMRAGTRRLAMGHYDTRIDRPTEPELAVLADDINHLAATLAASEQRRAALIGDVAHEMRTPLTTISGYLEGMNDGLFTPAEVGSTLRVEVARLHSLARDLAAVSRSEENGLSLERQPDDLVAVLSIVVERLRHQFDAAHVGITFEAPSPIPMTIDRERMVQAFTNVIGNALAYTPAGGSVLVVARRHGDHGVVHVTDTGRGIAAEDLQRVFERFYRADPHDHSGGTGIGLTISRAVVEAHGGSIVARSDGLGRGTTFEVTLPAR
ncbi:MAG: ATP-binding protein [Actinomycetota bacterium]|nr:ATP-binding protein [Actinomycetota bacterium]